MTTKQRSNNNVSDHSNKQVDENLMDTNTNEMDSSRRHFLAATGLAVFAAGASGCAPLNQAMSKGEARSRARAIAKAPRPPFDSFRDYMEAVEAHGLLIRVPKVDQDSYHATALFFKATDRYGKYATPAMMFEKVKVDGEWIDGPVIANHQGHWFTDNIIWGLDYVPNDHYKSYQIALDHMYDMLDKNGGAFPMIPPVKVDAKTAPCKEVVLTGDQIDITKFAFLKTNPTDAGRYVNTGSVFMDDPKIGPNFGTYRNEIKGPRTLVINPEPGQTGHRMIKAAEKRGQKTMPVSIVIGQDPVVWMISGTKLVNRFTTKGEIDELALAGGMRGKPIDVVKSETNDMYIPAHAEMVIEGEVLLDHPGENEGPFGEMFGYMGPAKDKNWVINITTVTHRKKPWMMNAFTGMQRGMVTAPMDAIYVESLRPKIPNIVGYTNPQDTMGVVVMSIDKKEPGEGIKAGEQIARRNPIAKVIIVVDKDINILDRTDVMFAVGSRWQPVPANKTFKRIFGLRTDPSQVVPGRTSKIVIDATIQLPGEGGMEEFPLTNRQHLNNGAPKAFDEVEESLIEVLNNWERI